MSFESEKYSSNVRKTFITYSSPTNFSRKHHTVRKKVCLCCKFLHKPIYNIHSYDAS